LPTFETAIRGNITDENGRNARPCSTDAEIRRIAKKNHEALGEEFSKLLKSLFGMLAANSASMETMLNFDQRNAVFACRLRYHGGDKKSYLTLPNCVGPLARRSS